MLKVDDTILVLVDVQGKLANIMHDSEELLANLSKLIQGANLLEIPIIWLEQYPKGLGPTADVLQEYLVENEPIAKMSFSAYGNEIFSEELRNSNRNNILVAGIESHICVYQTVRDLLHADLNVEVVVDCISSRTRRNSEIGINKMNALGAKQTSVEMVLFELLGTAEHPNFKEISKLIK